MERLPIWGDRIPGISTRRKETVMEIRIKGTR